jgi:hypothetical protein
MTSAMVKNQYMSMGRYSWFVKKYLIEFLNSELGQYLWIPDNANWLIKVSLEIYV